MRRESEVWIAVSVSVHLTIVKKRLGLGTPPHEILQILTLTIFETTTMNPLVRLDPPIAISSALTNPLNLFGCGSF